MLSHFTKVTIARNIPYQVIEDETLIVTPKEHMIHSLNDTGTFIWNLLRNSITVDEILNKLCDEILNKLCDEYEIDRDKLEPDVQKFLSEALDKKLIEIAD
jgi:hypothetical protein